MYFIGNFAQTWSSAYKIIYYNLYQLSSLLSRHAFIKYGSKSILFLYAPKDTICGNSSNGCV